jgi:hypothetical protein
LGTVVYQLAEDQTNNIKLKAMPLEFILLTQSHTGKYLAEIVGQVAEKFGITDKLSPCFLSFMLLFPRRKIDIFMILDMWACKQ